MEFCPFCSTSTEHIYHRCKCPKIKDVQYFPDGQIKAISFFEHSDIKQPNNDAVVHISLGIQSLSAEIDERIELIRQGLLRSVPV